MERFLVFKNLRKRIYPQQWHDGVAQSFPTLHSLMNSMLSDVPSERPCADEVADSIEALLAEYTVQSLDRLTSQRRKDLLLLRVEADDIEGILPKTIKVIKEASPQVEIVQYGLRGQGSKAIMEFAVSSSEEMEGKSVVSGRSRVDHEGIKSIFDALMKEKDIKLVRRVTEEYLAFSHGDSGDVSR